MNILRNAIVRVRDFTEPQPIPRKRIPTLTDGPGLFFALGSGGKGPSSQPRFRKPEADPGRQGSGGDEGADGISG
jgi:hypothetical protein